MVPAGFKVVEGSSGEEITVQNGVVIEDSAGNQFVWIPVGVVTKNDGTKSNEIKLGRYTFSTSSPGTPTLEQAAFTGDNPSEPDQTYANTVPIGSYNYQELTTPRDGVASDGLDGLNATAKNLGAFVQSVSDNGGYYLARYEASYGSGTSTSDYKPLSKPSTATRTSSSTSLTPRMLWNWITQIDAAKVARNMYAGNKDINGNNVGVESDLVNSYAWDTAIVYIQEMEHADYANKKDGNGTLYNTGPNGVGDVVCNIYDMVANEYEWTTEYSAHKDSSRAYPCVGRGGHYRNSTYYMACRNLSNATISDNFISFRPVLYVQ